MGLSDSLLAQSRRLEHLFNNHPVILEQRAKFFYSAEANSGRLAEL